MFVAPNGTVAGSVNWAEVQRLVNDRDDKTITKDGYDALKRLLDDHNGVLRDAAADEKARAEVAAKENEAALSAQAEPAAEAPANDERTVDDLKAELKKAGLPTSGSKAELVDRLNSKEE